MYVFTYACLLIFVVGMPRSGTSLVERIFGSHSQVHGAGEFQILNRTLMQYQDTLPHPAKISIATAESSDLEKIRKDVLDQFKSLTGRRERIVSKNLTNGRNLGNQIYHKEHYRTLINAKNPK